MKRFGLTSILLVGSVLAPTTGSAQFRVENGKLRYVHTLTHLLQANFRGRGSGGRAAGAVGGGAALNTQR